MMNKHLWNRKNNRMSKRPDDFFIDRNWIIGIAEPVYSEDAIEEAWQMVEEYKRTGRVHVTEKKRLCLSDLPYLLLIALYIMFLVCLFH